MSTGTLIGGVVGGVIGGVAGWFATSTPAGAYYGAYLGFSIGAGIGSYIDPITPDIQTPGKPSPGSGDGGTESRRLTAGSRGSR